MNEVAGTIPTDAGMWLLWQPEAFASVQDYESWARELEDHADILRHVAEGECVPINIGHDMSAQFVVRVAGRGGPLRKAHRADLTERERRYLTVSSEPYAFVSHGTAKLSAIEGVIGGLPSGLPTIEATVPAGEWRVTVHMIEWDREPGAKVDGKPTADALPDFVLLVNQGRPVDVRASLKTFDPV